MKLRIKIVFGDGREEDAANRGRRREGLKKGDGGIRRRINGGEDAGHVQVRVELNESF